MLRRMTVDEFDECRRTDARALTPANGVAAIVLDVTEGVRSFDPSLVSSLPIAVLADRVHEHDAMVTRIVDCFVSPDEIDDVRTVAERCPVALATCAQVLRRPFTDVDDGLLVESLAYSTLQGGAEFRRWVDAERGSWRPSAAEVAVRVDRTEGQVVATLCDTDRHNAYSRRMRDELRSILDVVLLDPSVESFVLCGDGPTFCSGGDRSEFGSLSNGADAHLVRTTDSVASALARIAERLGERFVARLHGSCIGAGVELAAFAGRVIASRGATFRLPEVGFGLVPGAGGTVSVPRRIGRHHTAWLAFTGRSIDATTARSWGLVDEVVDEP